LAGNGFTAVIEALRLRLKRDLRSVLRNSAPEPRLECAGGIINGMLDNASKSGEVLLAPLPPSSKPKLSLGVTDLMPTIITGTMRAPFSSEEPELEAPLACTSDEDDAAPSLPLRP
jgi:hypothetical protein